MPSIPDITPLLTRNLSVLAIAETAVRLSVLDTRSDALAPATLLLGRGEATDDFLDHVADLIETNLRQLTLEPELLRWMLTPVLSAELLDDVLATMTTWRFTGTIQRSVASDPPPPGTWIDIRAEDGFIDVLLQQLTLLGNTIANMHHQWSKISALGVKTYPELSSNDRCFADLELFVIEAMEIDQRPLVAPGANFRFDAVTIGHVHPTPDAGARTGDTLGFVQHDVTDRGRMRLNAEAIVNESAQELTASLQYRDETILVDPYYGHCYHSSVLANSAGIYAAADANHPLLAHLGKKPGLRIDLPEATHGHLAVPFRRIPRYRVTSGEEFVDLFIDIATRYRPHAVPGGPVGPLLLRGQTREYTLERPPGVAQHLFGEPTPIEPALLSSATRRTTSRSTYDAFAATVGNYLERSSDQDAARRWREIAGTAHGEIIKRAFAQHYGLATDCLDWTTDALTALWFATTQLRSAGPGMLQPTPVADDQDVVVYLLRPEARQVVNLQEMGFPATRLQRQHGWISIASWGWRANRVARYLLAAIYLPGVVRREIERHLPTTAYLFPGSDQDMLVERLNDLGRRTPNLTITRELGADLYEI